MGSRHDYDVACKRALSLACAHLNTDELQKNLADFAASRQGALLKGHALIGCCGLVQLSLLSADPDGALQKLRRELQEKFGVLVGIYEAFQARNAKGTSAALQVSPRACKPASSCQTQPAAAWHLRRWTTTTPGCVGFLWWAPAMCWTWLLMAGPTPSAQDTCAAWSTRSTSPTSAC